MYQEIEIIKVNSNDKLIKKLANKNKEISIEYKPNDLLPYKVKVKYEDIIVAIKSYNNEYEAIKNLLNEIDREL